MSMSISILVKAPFQKYLIWKTIDKFDYIAFKQNDFLDSSEIPQHFEEGPRELEPKGEDLVEYFPFPVAPRQGLSQVGRFLHST